MTDFEVTFRYRQVDLNCRTSTTNSKEPAILDSCTRQSKEDEKQGEKII